MIEGDRDIFCVVGSDACPETAKALERDFGFRLTRDISEENSEPQLRIDADGLALVSRDVVLRADFLHMEKRMGEHNLNRELLVKAARIKREARELRAVDATAGFGEDAFLLAAAGFSVCLYERDRIIAALLQDALRRARKLPTLEPVIKRMKLIAQDSISALPLLEASPDVVLLDPMFPEKRKNALTKKKFQLLHMLERPCADERELLHAALACRPRKIVIKRPIDGGFLADMKPSYSLKGKIIRYDCITPPQN